MLRMSTILTACFAVFLTLAAGCQPSEAPPGSVPPDKSKEPETASDSETTDQTKVGINGSAGQSAKVVVSTDASSSEWATLTGQFIYDGPAPKPKFITPIRNTPFCSKHQIPDEQLVVNQENNGIVDIVIFLRKKPSRINPAYDNYLDEEVVLDNVNCRFEPHVQFVRTGQKLVVGNKDDEGHNTNISVSPKNQSFNQIIPAGGKFDMSFGEPERRQTQINCNIHPWMSAVLVIQDHPYMAKTDENGKFEIKDLPTGEELEFQFWQSAAGYVRNIKESKAEFSKKGRVKLTLDGDFDLGTVKVDPANFED